MRNVVVGSFLGFVLGAAFLAACGSGREEAPPQAAVPGEWRWGPLQPADLITTSATLSPGDVWTSTASYDNGATGRRNRFAALEVAYTPSPSMSATTTLHIGILPAPDGSRFASEPDWVGTITLSLSDSGRAVASHVLIPPMPLKFALRIEGGSATVRVTSLTIVPYNEQQL